MESFAFGAREHPAVKISPLPYRAGPDPRLFGEVQHRLRTGVALVAHHKGAVNHGLADFQFGLTHNQPFGTDGKRDTAVAGIGRAGSKDAQVIIPNVLGTQRCLVGGAVLAGWAIAVLLVCC